MTGVSTGNSHLYRVCWSQANLPGLGPESESDAMDLSVALEQGLLRAQEGLGHRQGQASEVLRGPVLQQECCPAQTSQGEASWSPWGHRDSSAVQHVRYSGWGRDT